MSLNEGIYKLKNGALFAIVGDILALAGIVMAVMSIGLGFNTPDLNAAFVLLGAIFIPFLIATVLGIVAFIFWFQATGKLKQVRDDLGIGRTGMILMIIGILLIVLSMIIAIPIFTMNAPQYQAYGPEMPMPPFAGVMIGMVTFMAIGGLIAIIGTILFGIMLIRLSKVEGVDQGFNTAGILYLIGVVAMLIFAIAGSVLMFVSQVLIYMSASKTLENLKTHQSFS